MPRTSRFPQRRRRTFVIGCRRGLELPFYPTRRGIVDGSPSQHFPTVADAIGDLPEIEMFDELFESDGLNVRLSKPSLYASLLRGETSERGDRSQKRRNGVATLTGCLRTAHTQTTVRRFRKTKPGEVEPVSRYYRLAADGLAPTIRAGTNVDHGKTHRTASDSSRQTSLHHRPRSGSIAFLSRLVPVPRNQMARVPTNRKFRAATFGKSCGTDDSQTLLNDPGSRHGYSRDQRKPKQGILRLDVDTRYRSH